MPTPPLRTRSGNCTNHGSGLTPTLGSLRPRTCLPNLISSASDIRRRRSRSFCNWTSLDSKLIDIAGLPAEVGRVLYSYRRSTPHSEAHYNSIAGLAVNDNVIARRFYSGQFDF